MEKNEELFLKQYDSSQYEKMSVAVDLLVFTIEDEKLKVVMIRREEYPYKEKLALPGVFVGIKETLDEAVKRGIEEEAGLSDIYFEQLYTWGEVKRDPRMRILSVSYLALVPCERLHLKAGKRTTEAGLFSVEELLNSEDEIAFDHRQMIAYARERLKNKVEYTRIAFELLPKEFTLPKLQSVYEILLGKKLYKANFRKKIGDFVEETSRMEQGTNRRPGRFYRQKEGKENDR